MHLHTAARKISLRPARPQFHRAKQNDIEALNILRVDVLVLGMPTCIRRCFALIAAHEGMAYTLNTIPHDRGPCDMLCRGDSADVLQVESWAQRSTFSRLRPRQFYSLMVEVAIVRPYLRRSNGEETEDYFSPKPSYNPKELKHILNRTLVVPIFQEQAMKIAPTAPRLSSGEANQLLKAMATFRAKSSLDIRDRLFPNAEDFKTRAHLDRRHMQALAEGKALDRWASTARATAPPPARSTRSGAPPSASPASSSAASALTALQGVFAPHQGRNRHRQSLNLAQGQGRPPQDCHERPPTGYP